MKRISPRGGVLGSSPRTDQGGHHGHGEERFGEVIQAVESTLADSEVLQVPFTRFR